MAFSPDGNIIASGSCNLIAAPICLENIAAGEKSTLHWLAPGPRRLPIVVLLCIPYIGWLLAAIILISLRVKNDKLKTVGLSFSPDGKFLLSAHNENGLYLWDVETKKKVKIIEGASITCAVYSPDGRLALAGNSINGSITLRSIATGEALATLSGHTGAVNSIAFSKDGKLAVSGSSDKTLKLWDVTNRCEIAAYPGHDGGVTSVAFSPDGRYVLSGSLDGTLKFWETNSGKEMLTIVAHTFGIRSVAISPNGRFAASGGDDCTLKLWDLSDV